MVPLWLFLTVSGLAVTAVFSEITTNVTAFANPPPLPATGMYMYLYYVDVTISAIPASLPSILVHKNYTVYTSLLLNMSHLLLDAHATKI